MKWFKHYSDAHSNLKTQAVIAKFGVLGYGFWWVCVELTAQQGSNFRILGEKDWKRGLAYRSRLSLAKVELLLTGFAEERLIDSEALQAGDLYIPKLSDYGDEYSGRRKPDVPIVSRQAPDSIVLDKIRIDKKRIDKNTSEKISRVKEITFNPLGSEIIKAFETVDPKNKTLYGNKTQRAACDFLITQYGMDRVMKAIEVLPRSNLEPYFPTITTPYELKERWKKLEGAFVKKSLGSSKPKTPLVV